MKIKKLLVLLFIVISIISCNRASVKNNEAKNDTIKTDSINKAKNVLSDKLLMATLWFQKSAEMRAIYYQTYNFAKSIIENKLPYSDSLKPKAVVVDIDETVLDNSTFEAHCITDNVSYSPKEWTAWVNKASAKALPGALDFLNFAKSKGVETIYISNRKTVDIEKTIENLKKLGFPFCNKDHVFLRDSVSTKKYRRQVVNEKYDVLLYIGDNLADLSKIFDHRDTLLAKNIVDKNSLEFGKDYLILPNPMYGGWVKPILNNNMRISDEKKDSLMKAKLDTY